MISTKLMLLLIKLAMISCWPSGAPEKVCNSMLPSHADNQARDASQSPFVIVQSYSNYQPKDRIKVVIQAPEGISFKGLMVQAYDPNTQQPIGLFQPGRGLKPLDSCSSVTHSDRRSKRSAVLVWEAPAQSPSGGSVAFRGTMVQKFSDFYSGINSILAKAKA